MKVALWAGIGFGTVHLVTNRVMKAVCSDVGAIPALHREMLVSSSPVVV